MRAGQAVQLGAVELKGFENGEAALARVDQRPLGLDDVEIGKSAAIEPVADQIDRAGVGGDNLGRDTARLAGLLGQGSLGGGDLPLQSRLGADKVEIGRGLGGAGLIDGAAIGVVAPERDRATDDRGDVAAVVQISQTRPPRRVLDGLALLDPDLGGGQAPLGLQQRQIDGRGWAGDLIGRAEVFQRGRVDLDLAATPERGESTARVGGSGLGFRQGAGGFRDLGLGPVS